ncbi:hypothetical protein K1Y78_57675, partial [Streptomyces sp. tea 10]|nr:hypothetical protein [Streptomyces sp. tea 10]
ARADRHEQELRDASHRCRETAQLVRTGAAALAERVAAVESIAQVGAPMAAALSTVLGVGLAVGHAASASWGGTP